MQKQGQFGVYKLFKLGKGQANTFNDEFKKLERDLHVVQHDYADMVNLHSKINGSLYEFNEEASILYWQNKPYKKQIEFTKFEEILDETENISTMKTIEEADAEIKDLNKSNLESLRLEYLELSNKKAHHLWKEDKLVEEIDKLKN